MKKPVLFSVSLLTLCLCSVMCADKGAVLVEAEAFENCGGWVNDQQSMDVMGSPYLIAHGAGVPVEDACTLVKLPSKGMWRVYARTRDWTAPWTQEEGPGAFTVLVDGEPLENVCGTGADHIPSSGEWHWQYAGSFEASSRDVRLSLHDLTGFDGRCDAVCLTRDENVQLPETVAGMASLRRALVPSYGKVTSTEEFDLVVVGGGVSGMCAAVAAARGGMKVALVNDRPVLGGNNSQEIRIHLSGIIELEPYPNLGNLIKEFGHSQCSNGAPAECFADDKKLAFVQAEPLISLYMPYHVNKVDCVDGRIAAVYGQNIVDGSLVCLKGRWFADCTGDATVGYLAGADILEGREARSEYGESYAPLVRDDMKNGVTLLWDSVEESESQPFPEFDYGAGFSEESVQRVTKSNWSWETGLFGDMINGVEQIRDYALLMIYANWSYLKNHSSDSSSYANRRLGWVQCLAGKRESRRLAGDLILTENDIVDAVEYPDGTASTSWSIDLHMPLPENSRFFPGREFRTCAEHEYFEPYPIPYRCLYSRNIPNLFMAGRNVSATHVALGSVRVMRTCAMMGEVVGLAARVCKAHDADPKRVYSDYLEDLKAQMREGAGKQGLSNDQTFSTHGCFPPSDPRGTR